MRNLTERILMHNVSCQKRFLQYSLQNLYPKGFYIQQTLSTTKSIWPQKVSIAKGIHHKSYRLQKVSNTKSFHHKKYPPQNLGVLGHKKYPSHKVSTTKGIRLQKVSTAKGIHHNKYPLQKVSTIN